MPLVLYPPVVSIKLFGYGAPATPGVDGQIYVEIVSGSIYGCSLGAWSVAASITPNGALSTVGTVSDTPFVPSAFPIYLYGNTVPTGDFGLNGQIYIDFFGGNLYAKSYNVWYRLGALSVSGATVSPAPLYENFPVSLVGIGAPKPEQTQRGQIYIDSSTGSMYAKQTTLGPATQIAAGTPVPVNTSLPTISGTAQQNQTLTLNVGGWSNTPTSYNVVVRRDGVSTVVPTATGSPTVFTYVIVSGDVGHVLTFAVAAVNGGGTSTTVVSLPTATVTASVSLGPTTATFQAGTAPGTAFTTFTGLSGGETIVSVSPNDGRVLVNSAGTQALIGMTSSSAGTVNFTYTSSLGNTLVQAVTVTAATAAVAYRADSTNTELTNVIPATGGAGYAATTILQCFSQNAIASGSTIYIGIATAATSATGTILEIDIPNATDFAASFLYPATTSLSAIPTTGRTQATVVGGGASVVHYTPGSVPTRITEMQVIVPTTVPANTAYNILFTHEAIAGRTAAVSNMVVNWGPQASNIIQRYGGALTTTARAQAISNISNASTNVVITVASSTGFATGSPVVVTGTTNYNATYIIASISGNNLTCTSGTSGRATETTGTCDPGHIATNAVMTATSITPYGSVVNTGSTAYMTVAYVRVPFAANSTIEAVGSNGNSKQDGNFEGVYGATTPDGVVHGDRSGDAKGNRGSARLAWNLGKAVSQLSRGSDRDLYRMIVPTYTASISGTTLTVSAIASGAVYPGQQVIGASAGTVITAGTLFTASCAVNSPTLTVSQIMQSANALAVGQSIYSNGTFIGTISALGTGTGGTGTYTLSANAAAASAGTLMSNNLFTVNNSQTLASGTLTAQSNYTMRQTAITNTNCHRMIGMCPTNELGPLPSGTAPATAYAASTAVALDQVRFNGANFYICGGLFDNAGGTTGASSAPTGTTPGVAYQDGTVYWYYIGSTLSGSAATALSQDCYGAGWVGQRRQRERLDRAANPKCKIYGVTQTPLTNSYNENIASGAYTYNSGTGVFTMTVATPSRFNSNAFVQLVNFGTGFNGVWLGMVSGSTVSVTVATGLTLPSTTGILYNQFQDPTGQTIQATYTAQTAIGTGMKAWINTFLRNASLARNVLGYLGVVDMDQYLESGNPTTPSAETAVWGYLTDGSGNRVQATSEGGHETSFGYERAYVAAAADTTFTTAFAA